MAEQIRCSGRSLQDKHTHYEIQTNVGPFPTTIEIPGYIYDAFRERYGKKMERIFFEMIN